jgi:ABC-type polysaccharide/polyol phosphate export permease
MNSTQRDMQNQQVIVYEADSRNKMGFLTIWVIMLKNILSSRELIKQLFKRDFLMSYKKSFLGLSWLFISPLIGIVSWVFMNATGILNPGDVGIPYPAYVLISSSIWGLFMGFFSSATETLGAGSGFIMQVKYPHEALLVKQTAQHLANFLLSFTLNIAVIIIFGVIPSWKIIFFPFLVLPLFLLGAGIGLVVSVASVVAVDLGKGFNVVVSLLMYVTPVIYSPKSDNPLLHNIIFWNPLTYLVGDVRDIIIYGKIEHLERFLVASFFALMVFLFSWRLFFISEDKVIEKMI